MSEVWVIRICSWVLIGMVVLMVLGAFGIVGAER